MVCSRLGRKGCGHTTKLRRRTSECTCGTCTPCMTCQLTSYFAAAVPLEVPLPSMQGNYDVHLVEGWQVFFVRQTLIIPPS
jgi:hypothetical protein